MTQTTSVVLVIALGVFLANLPFFSQRLLGVYRCKTAKTLPIRLAELLLAYFVVGAIAMFLEQTLGQKTPQGWEFYAITAALFMTLAFPGFVYRYLLRRSHP